MQMLFEKIRLFIGTFVFSGRWLTDIGAWFGIGVAVFSLLVPYPSFLRIGPNDIGTALVSFYYPVFLWTVFFFTFIYGAAYAFASISLGRRHIEGDLVLSGQIFQENLRGSWIRYAKYVDFWIYVFAFLSRAALMVFLSWHAAQHEYQLRGFMGRIWGF